MLGGKQKGWWEIDAYHVNLYAQLVCYPAIMNALEMMALTENQQETVKVWKKTNLVRSIVGVKKADKRTIDELRVEVGMKES